MNDDIVNTIEVLDKRIRAKEDEANKLKKLVNELCTEAGIPVRYNDVTENGLSLADIRSDQFYGQTLTAAIRNYLERRKASGLGAASVTEIFSAVKSGGYKFETANDENAKIGVGNTLRKTSSIFHRLPNGQYGLLIWYPTAKAKPESNPDQARKPGRPSKLAGKPTSQSDVESITNKDIRDVVLAQTGEFRASDIEAEIRAKFPSKALPKAKIPNVLFELKTENGLVRQISPRVGKKGALYAKV